MAELTRDERYQMYKKLLLEWVQEKEDLLKIAAILSSNINQNLDVEENTEKLQEVWVAVNILVNKRFAILNDALWEWFKEELANDQDLPHWDTWDIILNREAHDKLKEESEMQDFATLNDIMLNARPWDGSKEESDIKKKKVRRVKNKLARKVRKEQ